MIRVHISLARPAQKNHIITQSMLPNEKMLANQICAAATTLCSGRQYDGDIMWATKFPVSGLDFPSSVITLNIKSKQCSRLKAFHPSLCFKNDFSFTRHF